MKKAKIVVSYILAVLLFCSAALSVVMASAFSQFRRLPAACEKIVDDDYAEKMNDALQDRLRIVLALSALDPEDISDVFNTETVRHESIVALNCTMSNVYGLDEGKYSFASETLRARIEEKLRAYADENGIEYDAAGAAETYTAVCTAVSAEFSVLSAKYTAKIAPAVSKLMRVLSLCYIPIIVTAALAAAIWIINRENKFRAALTLLHPLYFAAFIPCVLFTLLKHKDYLSNTVITDGTLSNLMQRVYSLVCDGMCFMALAATLIFAVALIFTVVYMAASTAKGTYTEDESADETPANRRFEDDDGEIMFIDKE